MSCKRLDGVLELVTALNQAINVGRLSVKCQRAARAGKARDEGIRLRGEAAVIVGHTATTN